MKKTIIILAIIVLLVSCYFFQNSLMMEKQRGEAKMPLIFIPGEFVGGIILSGFKGIAADLLWIKCDDLWHTGRFAEMVPLYRIITYLNPRFIEVWATGAWHIAYNIGANVETPEEKMKFINIGMDFLKEGIQLNPNRYELYFEMGWTMYFWKLKNYDMAIKYIKEALKYKHPSYVDRMLAHAYEKKGDKKSALSQWKSIKRLYPDDVIAPRFIDRLEKMR